MINGYSSYPASGPHGAPNNLGEPADVYSPWYGIGFGAAISRAFAKMMIFKGYASRGEYWWFQLFNFMVSFALNVFVIVVSTVMYDETSNSTNLLTGVVVIVVLLMSLFLVLPLLAVTWRRLHDAGFAGPWFFLSFIPVFGSIAVLVMLAMPTSIERRNPAWE